MDPEELPKNPFREILSRYYGVEHNLRTPPNIVNCNCEQFELAKYSLLPYVSSQPLYHYLDDRPTVKVDPTSTLVAEKFHLNIHLNKMWTLYQTRKKKKGYQKNNALGYVPSIVAKVIDLQESDPDEYFQGYYNWYYTGGCLEVVEIDQVHFTFHIIGDKMNVLRVAQYPNISPGDSPTLLTLDETILEVTYSSGHVIMRSRLFVYLYSFDPSTLGLELVLSCEGSYPFICARLRDYVSRKTSRRSKQRINNNSNSNTDLICLDLDHILRVVPLDKSEEERELSLSVHFEGVKDKWSSFVVLNDSSLCLVVTRTKLILVNVVEMAVKGSVDLTKLNVLSKCNRISGVWKSKFKEIGEYTGELIYLGLVHDFVVLRLITDPIKGSLSFRECIRWSHQLKTPPLIMKSVIIDDDTTELLYVSSLANNSTRILHVSRTACTKADEDEDGKKEEEVEEDEEEEELLGLHSYHPPYKPLDMASSLHLSNQHGVFIETRYNFNIRVNLSTIGLGIIKDPQKINSVLLLTMNSMGDIYHQSVKAKSSGEGTGMNAEERERFLNEMRQTRDQFVDTEDTQNLMTVTGNHNLKSLFAEAVYGAPAADVQAEEESIDRQDRIRKMLRRAKWNRPMGKLRRYKDVLSQDLLAVWDVSDDDEEDRKDIVDDDEKVQRFMQPSEKVSAWLQSAHVHGEEDLSMEVGNSSRFKVGHVEEQEEETMPPSASQEMYLDMSTGADVSTQQRKAAKRKSRVLGF